MGGSKKDEEEFTDLLKRYVKYKSKYDKNYKTLTPDQIQDYKNEFKQQEEKLSKCYNLLKNKKTKYYLEIKPLNYVKEKIE